MKHFGNSLSYEEIIEDMKFSSTPIEYTGKRFDIVNVGHYENGVFVKTGTQDKTLILYATLENSGKWWLTNGEGDSGLFDSIEQVKRRAANVFGNGIKWKITKRA